jgi:rhodanese-related sulfurtransferase
MTSNVQSPAMDIAAEHLLQAAAGPEPCQILDVRSAREYTEGRVPGAVHLPFWLVSRRRVAELGLRRGAPLVVYCGHGPRAQWAASRLRRLGFTNVACLRGHMQGWRRAGLAEERG